MKPKTSRITRLLRLITLLESEAGLPGHELADRLDISRRTLFRDLKTLQQAGVPCFHERRTGYRIRRGFFLPPTNLSSVELVSLHVLLKVAQADSTLPMRDILQTATRKLLSSMDESKIQACESLMHHIITHSPALATTRRGTDRDPHTHTHPDPHTHTRTDAPPIPPAAKAEPEKPDCGWRWFSVILQPINDHRTCNITHQNEPRPTTFEPHRLYVRDRIWYILGRSSPSADFRLIRLDHITSIQPTDKRFHPLPKLDITQIVRNSWRIQPEDSTHNVALRVRPEYRHLLERVWHPTQTTTPHANGHATLRFQIDGLSEIASWIAPRIHAFSAIKPDILRDRVVDQLQQQITHANSL